MTCEGIIKFQLEYNLSPPSQWQGFPSLEAWRMVFYRLGLIGKNPDRYQGLSYGNISQRLGRKRFIISGTQTGGMASLAREHYCMVEKADLEANRVWAKGPIQPSSETLTHAAVYQASYQVAAVIHVHCPEIWEAADILDYPQIPQSIEYGTPAMAKAVAALVKRRPFSGVVVMKGHQDGILSYANNIENAGQLLVKCLAEVLAWEKAVKRS